MSEFPTDFLKVCEAAHGETLDSFKRNYEQLKCKLTETSKQMDKTFGAKCSTICLPLTHLCSVGVEDNYQQVVEDVLELRTFRKNIKCDIEMINKIETSELMTDISTEPNQYLVQRLVSLEKTKALTQKVLRNLLIELDSYQKKINAVVEGEVLEKLVESRKAHEKRLEVQLNQEVKRIEENFATKWIEASKPRRRVEQIDWMLRTELQPRIVRLEVALFQRREQMVKVNKEIEEITKRIAEQEEKDEQIEEKFADLTSEFEKLSDEIKGLNFGVKSLQRRIKSAATSIDVECQVSRDKLIDMNENNLVKDRIKEVYRDNLTKEIEQSRAAAVIETSALNCIIAGLTKEICRLSRDTRDARIQKAKLQTDLRHLLTEENEEVVGRDYIGGNFIKLVGPKCQ